MANDAPGWSDLIGMGLVAAVVLAAGLAAGWLLDSLLHSGPVFLLIGLMFGVGGAISYTIVEFRKYLKN